MLEMPSVLQECSVGVSVLLLFECARQHRSKSQQFDMIFDFKRNIFLLFYC